MPIKKKLSTKSKQTTPVGFKASFMFIKQERRLFTGIGLWFLVSLWLFAGLPSQLAYLNLRLPSEEATGGISSLVNTFTNLSFGQLGVAQSESQQLSSVIITIIFTLCFIAALRLRSGGTKVGVRDILYTATTPLIPFVLLLILSTLILIPSVLGLLLIGYTFSQTGFSGIETTLLSLLSLALAGISVYFIVQFIFGLVIVTLPNKPPIMALKEAKELIAGRRRWLLVRVGLLFLVVAALHIVVLIPFILFDQLLNNELVPLVPIVLDILKVFSWLFSVTYLYKLYRSML